MHSREISPASESKGDRAELVLSEALIDDLLSQPLGHTNNSPELALTSDKQGTKSENTNQSNGSALRRDSEGRVTEVQPSRLSKSPIGRFTCEYDKSNSQEPSRVTFADGSCLERQGPNMWHYYRATSDGRLIRDPSRDLSFLKISKADVSLGIVEGTFIRAFAPGTRRAGEIDYIKPNNERTVVHTDHTRAEYDKYGNLIAIYDKNGKQLQVRQVNAEDGSVFERNDRGQLSTVILKPRETQKLGQPPHNDYWPIQSYKAEYNRQGQLNKLTLTAGAKIHLLRKVGNQWVGYFKSDRGQTENIEYSRVDLNDKTGVFTLAVASGRGKGNVITIRPNNSSEIKHSDGSRIVITSDGRETLVRGGDKFQRRQTTIDETTGREFVLERNDHALLKTIHRLQAPCSEIKHTIDCRYNPQGELIQLNFNRDDNKEKAIVLFKQKDTKGNYKWTFWKKDGQGQYQPYGDEEVSSVQLDQKTGFLTLKLSKGDRAGQELTIKPNGEELTKDGLHSRTRKPNGTLIIEGPKGLRNVQYWQEKSDGSILDFDSPNNPRKLMRVTPSADRNGKALPVDCHYDEKGNLQFMLFEKGKWKLEKRQDGLWAWSIRKKAPDGQETYVPDNRYNPYLNVSVDQKTGAYHFTYSKGRHTGATVETTRDHQLHLRRHNSDPIHVRQENKDGSVLWRNSQTGFVTRVEPANQRSSAQQPYSVRPILCEYDAQNHTDKRKVPELKKVTFTDLRIDLDGGGRTQGSHTLKKEGRNWVWYKRTNRGDVQDHSIPVPQHVSINQDTGELTLHFGKGNHMLSYQDLTFQRNNSLRTKSSLDLRTNALIKAPDGKNYEENVIRDQSGRILRTTLVPTTMRR